MNIETIIVTFGNIEAIDNFIANCKSSNDYRKYIDKENKISFSNLNKGTAKDMQRFYMSPTKEFLNDFIDIGLCSVNDYCSDDFKSIRENIPVHWLDKKTQTIKVQNVNYWFVNTNNPNDFETTYNTAMETFKYFIFNLLNIF